MTDYSTSPRDSTRVPLAHRIQLKFDRFSGFINEYVSNISPGGIFIRTETPEPPGQLLEFEFRLGDGFELIRGRGEVVWSRAHSDGPERPPGMGVRFTELSPGSKDLIYKIVDDYVAHGGKPFDLASMEAAPPPYATPPPAARPAAPAPSAAAGPAGAFSAPLPPLPRLPASLPERLAPQAPPASSAPAASSAPVTPGVPPPRSTATIPPAPKPFASPTSAGITGTPASPRGTEPPPELPWTLDIPAIRPVPGVPVITPRSPLEALGAPASPSAATTGPLAGPGGRESVMPNLEVLPPTAAAVPLDPLARMAADLPLLDDLDDLDGTAGDPGSRRPTPLAPAQAPLEDLHAAPFEPQALGSSPAFSSFDQRAERRRSRLPLIGLLVLVAVLGLATYLLRDRLLAWIDKNDHGAEPVQVASRGPRVAPVPAPPGGATAASSASTLNQDAPAKAAAPGAAAFSSAPGAGAPGSPVPRSPAAAGSAATAAPPTRPTGVPTGVSAPAVRAAAAGASPLSSPPASAADASPAPSSSPVAAATRPAAGATVTAITRITWKATRGGTDVVLWGNGAFSAQSFSHVRVGGQPVREVVRLTGITRPFSPPRLAARTAELQQIRVGTHPPHDLHVVLDLTGPEVEVTGIESLPGQLVIHLRGR